MENFLKTDLLELTQHYIVSALWIYKYYKDIVNLLLQLYKTLNNCTALDLYKISYEVWLQAKHGMYDPPCFNEWCIDMETL